MSYIDLEDEDLLRADENEIEVEEENLLVDGDENNEPNDNAENAGTGIDSAPSKDATKVAPKKRIVRNPQPKLNYDRLKGPRGLMALESSFKDVKYKGKGHEKEDLDTIMTLLEQWTHRLFPKFTFNDTLEKLEQLGHKKIVSNFVNRIRLGMVDDNDSFAQTDIVEDKDEPSIDPFDRLTEGNSLGQSTQVDQSNTGIQQSTLTDEQRERMIRNRLLAEERRLARMKARQEEEEARQQQNQQSPRMQVDGTRSIEDSEQNERFSQHVERSQVSSQQEPSNFWAEDEQYFDSLVMDQM